MLLGLVLLLPLLQLLLLALEVNIKMLLIAPVSISKRFFRRITFLQVHGVVVTLFGVMILL